MGVGGIGIWQLLIVLVIIILLFGTKKLKNVGGDLGGAIRSFKKSMKDGKKEAGEGENATVETAKLEQSDAENVTTESAKGESAVTDNNKQS